MHLIVDKPGMIATMNDKSHNMKMYIAILDEVPDFMVPTLVAHTILAAHINMCGNEKYDEWLADSFKKCTVRVNQKEFNKIANLDGTYLGHENTTLGAKKSCAIPIPCNDNDRPNVLRFARLWEPVIV
jgi:hypothetical protein